MATAETGTMTGPPGMDARTVLATFPGPGVLVDAGGVVVEANERADDFAAALRAGALDDLRDLLTAAATERTAFQDTVQLPLAHGGGVVDITVLPADADGAPAILVLGRNVTLDRNLRRALVESRQRYRDLVECSSEFGWETDSDGRFVFVSPRGALDYAADDLIGRDPRELLAREPVAESVWPFTADTAVDNTILWLRTAGDDSACLAVSSTPLVGPDGTRLGARGVCRDVTIERRQEDQLTQARRRDQMLSRLVRDIHKEIRAAPVLDQTSRAVVEALNAAACWIYAVEVNGGLYLAASHPSAAPPSPPAAATIDGFVEDADRAGAREVDGVLMAAAVHGTTLKAVIATARDAGTPDWTADDAALLAAVADQLGIAIAQSDLYDELQRLSRTDGLTGLLNRRAFLDEAGRRFAHALRTERPGAILYIDVNNFKRINDTRGHSTGDEVLTRVAELISRSLRAGDVVGRLGGDEFVVWLDETDGAGAETKAVALVAAAGELDALTTDPDHPVGLSIGVASARAGSVNDLSDLLDRADQAMFAAKQDPAAGPSRYRRAEAGA